MMRYGLSVFAAALLVFGALSYLIQFPDTIDTRVLLTTANPPIRVPAQISGRVSEILEPNSQSVQTGAILAVLENTADWRAVLDLENWLDKSSPSDSLPAVSNLGALQNDWSVFTQHWKDLQYFLQFNDAKTRVSYLNGQIEQLRQVNEVLANQTRIHRSEFDLAEKALNRQHALHKSNVIADAEYEKSEAAYLQEKRSMESIQEASIRNILQIRQLESQIFELRRARADQENEKKRVLDEDRRRALVACHSWTHQYLVRAPIGGRVSWSKIWSPQQFISAGEEILAIVPENPGQPHGLTIVAKGGISTTEVPKIGTGYKALVLLDGFPAREFGSIEARVSQLSPVPQKNEYQFDLALPDSLTTIYGKHIPFRQEMTGTARIITQERRICDRVFEKLGIGLGR
jgi:multidrug resistance efflux pump